MELKWKEHGIWAGHWRENTWYNILTEKAQYSQRQIPDYTDLQCHTQWAENAQLPYSLYQRSKVKEQKIRQILTATKRAAANLRQIPKQNTRNPKQPQMSNADPLSSDPGRGHLPAWGLCEHSPGCARRRLPTVSGGRQLGPPPLTGDPGKWCSQTAPLQGSTSTARVTETSLALKNPRRGI